LPFCESPTFYQPSHIHPHAKNKTITKKRTTDTHTPPPSLKPFAGQENNSSLISKQACYLPSKPLPSLPYLPSEMSEAVLSQILTSLADLKATQQLLSDKVRDDEFVSWS
jgi:hypothetical protein